MCSKIIENIYENYDPPLYQLYLIRYALFIVKKLTFLKLYLRAKNIRLNYLDRTVHKQGLIITPNQYNNLVARINIYIQGKRIFVMDCTCKQTAGGGCNEKHSLNLSYITMCDRCKSFWKKKKNNNKRNDVTFFS